MPEPTTGRDWHTEIAAALMSDQVGVLDDGLADTMAAALIDALGLHGWPHTYQPNNPHVEAARQARAEADQLRAELKRLEGARLISAIFGHHPGAPRPFALYRSPDRTPLALGAEFPDGAVALREPNTGWTTKSEGGAEQFADANTRVVWLSDEFDALATVETERDQAVTELRQLRASIARILDEADRWGAPRYARDLDPGLAALHDLATGLRALLADTPPDAPSATQTAEQAPQADQDTTKAHWTPHSNLPGAEPNCPGCKTGPWTFTWTDGTTTVLTATGEEPKP